MITCLSVGAKGGSGRSFFATHMADYCIDIGMHVLFVDGSYVESGLDLFSSREFLRKPSTIRYLPLQADYNIHELVRVFRKKTHDICIVDTPCVSDWEITTNLIQLTDIHMFSTKPTGPDVWSFRKFYPNYATAAKQANKDTRIHTVISPYQSEDKDQRTFRDEVAASTQLYDSLHLIKKFRSKGLVSLDGQSVLIHNQSKKEKARQERASLQLMFQEMLKHVKQGRKG